MDQPLKRIGDISPGNSWPQHLLDLICKKDGSTEQGQSQSDVTIKLDEIAACLCHVGMIEIGFVPTYIDIDPTSVRFMSEKERVVSLSTNIPSHHRNSDAGVISVSYRAIRENPKNLITHSFQRDVEHQDSATLIANQPSELSPEETEPLYIYTKQVDVTMLAQHGMLSLHGHMKSEQSQPSTSDPQPKPKSVHLDINIRNFLSATCSVNTFDVDALLPSQHWLNLIQLNGPAISDTLKIQFGKVLLTLVDGISFEPSLQHLSPELLIKIFDYLPIEDVCRVTQVSHYMYAVSDTDLFWLKRIERDFPTEAPEIRARFLISNSPTSGSTSDTTSKDDVPTHSSQDVNSTTSVNSTIEESIYREYVRLYQKHRPPQRRVFHTMYRRLIVPRRSFTPLLGLHPPLLRRFW